MTHRVNAMSLTDFTAELRNHGIPCSVQAARRMIETGVFGDAAYACRMPEGHPDEGVTYFIIPARLARWFVENADEVREDEEEAAG